MDGFEKSLHFLNGLGIPFSDFPDTCMVLSHIPRFRDLLNQAKQFRLMLKVMEGSPSPATFSADLGYSSHSSGYSSPAPLGSYNFRGHHGR